MSHTPGPWTKSALATAKCISLYGPPDPARDGRRNVVAFIPINQDVAEEIDAARLEDPINEYDDVAAGNARLLVAAPDVLQALQMFLQLNPTCHRGVVHCGECAVCLGSAALAKAAPRKKTA